MATIKEILLNTLRCIPKEVVITIIHEYAKCYGLPKLKNIFNIKHHDSDLFITCSNKEIFVAGANYIYVYDIVNYKHTDTIIIPNKIKGLSLYDNELFVNTDECMYVLNNKKIIRQFELQMPIFYFCVDDNNIYGIHDYQCMASLDKQNGLCIDTMNIDFALDYSIGVSNKYIYICHDKELLIIDKKNYKKVNDSIIQNESYINSSDLAAFCNNEIYVNYHDKLLIINKYDNSEIITIEDENNIGFNDVIGLAAYNNFIFMINDSDDKLIILERNLL
jgi:hypothetical protein